MGGSIVSLWTIGTCYMKTVNNKHTESLMYCIMHLVICVSLNHTVSELNARMFVFVVF